MSQTISVLFHINGSDNPVIITYQIAMQDNIQVISCLVDQGEHKNWLQLSRFELRSQYSAGIYTALFNEEVQKKNMATAQFVDRVYIEIMDKEQMPVDNGSLA